MTIGRRTGRPAKRPRRKTGSTEPTFVMLLADPEIRLLMRADNVDEKELRAMLTRMSLQYRDAPEPQKAPLKKRAGHANYRRGVGIMLINGHNNIFIARRNDVPGEAWQMPQGGIDSGETPRQAAFRELKEEIGTDNAEIVAESKQWLYYDLPADLAKKAWGNRWQGQRQKWFVMRYNGEDAEINIATEHPEFNAWRWAPLRELETLAVTFKKRLYATLLGEFAAIIQN